MATKAKFLLPLRNSDGTPFTGYSGYVYIVPNGEAVNADLPLTEDTNISGLYYRDNVEGGFYDIYIDTDKSGSPVAGDLWLSKYYHPIPNSFVSNDMLESFEDF